MAAEVFQLCGGCTDGAQSTVSMPQVSGALRFLTVNISLPTLDGMDQDRIVSLAGSYCFQCKKIRETQLPLNMFPHLFSSYRPLVEAEEGILCSRREADRQELSVIEAVTSATESHLEQLRQRKEALVSSIAQYNHLLSAVRRLPKEILLEIVMFTISEDREKGSLDVKSRIWALSQVCSRWRTIILGTPMLWSNITIKSCKSRYSMSIFLEYIRRSQHTPLDIEFASEETERSKNLFEQICSQSHRWRSSELHLHYSHWSHLSQVRNTLFQLRRLSINDADLNDWLNAMKPNDFFAFAPQLQTIQLGMNSDYFGPPHLAFQFPEESVTNFELWFVDVELQSLLSPIIPRSVRHMTIGTDTQYTSSKPFIPSVYPFITHLEIGSATWLLNIFTCPALDQLTLDDIPVNHETLVHVETFIDRSTRDRTFQILHLCCSSVSPDAAVTQLFRSVHFITDLQVSIEPDSDATEEPGDKDASAEMVRLLEPLLLGPDRSNDLLPALSSLDVDCSDFCPTAALYMLIHGVVDSRVNPPADYGGEKLSEFDFKDSSCHITLETYHDLLQRAEMNSGD